MIIKAFTLSYGASRFGPVIFGYPDTIQVENNQDIRSAVSSSSQQLNITREDGIIARSPGRRASPTSLPAGRNRGSLPSPRLDKYMRHNECVRIVDVLLQSGDAFGEFAF